MITFFFDDTTAKVWYDDTVGYLTTKIQRALTVPEMHVLSKALFAAIKKLKREKREVLICSVTDLQNCENWSVGMIEDLVQVVVGAEFKAGIDRKLFVRPTEKSSRNALVRGLMLVPNMNTSVHDHVLEAFREIERFRLTARGRQAMQAPNVFQKFFHRLLMRRGVTAP